MNNNIENNPEILKNQLRTILEGTDERFIDRRSEWIDEDGCVSEEGEEGAQQRDITHYKKKEAEKEFERIINILYERNDAGAPLIEVIKIAIEIDNDHYFDEIQQHRPNLKEYTLPFLFKKLISLPDDKIDESTLKAIEYPSNVFSRFRLFSPFDYREDSDFNRWLDSRVKRILISFEEIIQSPRVKIIAKEAARPEFNRHYTPS